MDGVQLGLEARRVKDLLAAAIRRLEEHLRPVRLAGRCDFDRVPQKLAHIEAEFE